MNHKYWIIFLSFFLSSCFATKIGTKSKDASLSNLENLEITKESLQVQESNIKEKEVSDIITSSPLVNHKYVLKKLGDEQTEPLKNTHLPYIVIDIHGAIYGFSGCNRLLGQVDLKEIQNGYIDFTGLGVTKMMCEEVSSKLENIFLSTLSQVVFYKFEDDQLILQNKNSEDVLIFTQEEKP